MVFDLEETKNNLQRCEPTVRKLAELLRTFEDAERAAVPLGALRTCYALLRQISGSKSASEDVTARMRSTLDALHDAMLAQNAQDTLARFEECIALTDFHPILFAEIRKQVVAIREPVLRERHWPWRALYDWALKVFSNPVGYQSHILQSRDDRPMNVTHAEFCNALAATESVMSAIRRGVAEIGSHSSAGRFAFETSEVNIQTSKISAIIAPVFKS